MTIINVLVSSGSTFFLMNDKVVKACIIVFYVFLVGTIGPILLDGLNKSIAFFLVGLAALPVLV